MYLDRSLDPVKLCKTGYHGRPCHQHQYGCKHVQAPFSLPSAPKVIKTYHSHRLFTEDKKPTRGLARWHRSGTSSSEPRSDGVTDRKRSVEVDADGNEQERCD